MDQQLLQHLREQSREIAPEYPRIAEDLEPWEHLWAITSSYQGTSAANCDCHRFIAYLAKKFSFDPLKTWKQFQKEVKNV